MYVCNFDKLVLEPDACKELLEEAEAHSNDPELGRTAQVLPGVQI